MPDISMCMDDKCPSKVHCYRYRAKPSQYSQSYVMNTRKPDDQKCDLHWTTSGYDDKYLVSMEELKTKGEADVAT